MVGLIDCDNFFCSCERVFRPDLATKPIVVLSNNDGCVVARSKEVKAMGIREGIPYYQLLEQYPDTEIVAFSSNYTLYADMSARVMALLREAAPDVIQYSIDEAFLDLSGMDNVDLKKWGENLCIHIRRATGIPISLGIAPTKTLAKVASKYAKKYPAYNKCCVISTDAQRLTALKLFPAADVWGIGHRMAKTLDYYGVHTALDFAQKSKSWIRALFHVTGLRTWEELNGTNAIQIDGLDSVQKKSIVTSRSFPVMLTTIDDLRSHVANYAARCAFKLRRQNSACAIVTVFIQSNAFRYDLPQYSNSSFYHFTTPTNTTNEIVEAALHMLNKIYREGIHYKRAGIMVSEITSAEAIQPDLFFYNPELSSKYKHISKALDSINSRLGADTVVLASQQYPEKATDGKSVKFVNAIRRDLKSPDYSTHLGAFTIS
jgi:DNA polymerase V